MAGVWAWGKPGAWALDAEEHDAVEHKDKGYDSSDSSSSAAAAQLHKPSDEFPSLAAAAATKTKKKKGQTLSLAEFTNGGQPVTHGTRSSSSRGLTTNELLALPTGPRERTAEELERGGRGFGYSSYGGGRGRSGEDPYPRSGSSRVSDEPGRGAPGGGFNRDSAPSRADETDDWGATKRSMLPERRERGAGFFGDSQSRADDSESWISNKTAPPSSNGRGGGGFDGLRERRGGFDMFNREGMNDGGADSDTWGRKREEGPSGGSAASDTWGRKREELSNGGGRPRLLLQPRTQPLANNNNTSDGEEQPASKLRSKATNPFGEARPREEVLKEKGQDWKQIDEKLESMKIREVLPDGQSFGRKGLGMGNDQGGAPEDRTERAWRKPDTPEAPPLRVENVEELPGNN